MYKVIFVLNNFHVNHVRLTVFCRVPDNFLQHTNMPLIYAIGNKICNFLYHVSYLKYYFFISAVDELGDDIEQILIDSIEDASAKRY